METIIFLRKKADEVLNQIANLKTKEQLEGLEVWEEVGLNEYKNELEMYVSAISSLKALDKFLRPKIDNDVLQANS